MENTDSKVECPAYDSLQGARSFVNTAKSAITEVVAELESQVVVECIIPFKYHSKVRGVEGTNVQSLAQEYSVSIDFPSRDSTELAVTDTRSEADDEPNAFKDTSNPLDVILITGKEENCLCAKEALTNLVPRNFPVKVPFRFHRAIIGPRGRSIDSMCEQYEVRISFPPIERETDWVHVYGPARNCEKATEALLTCVEKLQKKDREVWSHCETVQFSPENRLDQDETVVDLKVPIRFHRPIINERREILRAICDQFRVSILIPPAHLWKDRVRLQGPPMNCKGAGKALLDCVEELKEEKDRVSLKHRVAVLVSPSNHAYIIGPHGVTANIIAQKHDVSIYFPHVDSPHNHEIVVVGRQNQVNAAVKEILEIVDDVEDISVEVDIDYSLHAGLVRTKGKSLSKIVKDCEVAVYFPGEHGSNKVLISGRKKNVEVAKTFLSELAVNFKLDVREQGHSSLDDTGGQDR